MIIEENSEQISIKHEQVSIMKNIEHVSITDNDNEYIPIMQVADKLLLSISFANYIFK